jgi:hypothetical protein
MKQRTPTQQSWEHLVDFVEQHGGALSGESRDELYRLTAAYTAYHAAAAARANAERLCK